jgi:hypothetical protein
MIKWPQNETNPVGKSPIEVSGFPRIAEISVIVGQVSQFVTLILPLNKLDVEIPVALCCDI